jgi:hypothetical protein
MLIQTQIMKRLIIHYTRINLSKILNNGRLVNQVFPN